MPSAAVTLLASSAKAAKASNGAQTSIRQCPGRCDLRATGTLSKIRFRLFAFNGVNAEEFPQAVGRSYPGFESGEFRFCRNRYRSIPPFCPVLLPITSFGQRQFRSL